MDVWKIRNNLRQDCYNAEYAIDAIEYYAMYGNWPVSLAVWLLRRRIRFYTLLIKLITLLPKAVLKEPPQQYNDEIPF